MDVFDGPTEFLREAPSFREDLGGGSGEEAVPEMESATVMGR
jgi:hypothetical protein